MAPGKRPRDGAGAGGSHHDPLRAPRGGGISKRRRPVTGDRDGDIDMDSAPRISGDTAGRGGRNPRRANGDGKRGGVQGSLARLTPTARENLLSKAERSAAGKGSDKKVAIKIRGMKDSKASGNRDGGLRSLLDFIERKASKGRPITLGRAVVRGEDVCLTVSQEDAQNILRLNGYTFAGVPLAIETDDAAATQGSGASTTGQDGNTSDVKTKMLGMLASRYDADGLLLNLSSLGTDPIMIELKAVETKALAEKTFKALLFLVSQRFDSKDAKDAAIQAVSLANNGIQDVKEVFNLARDLPRLRRLDLSGNSLQDFSGLSKWRHEFRLLEELHLVGNPLTSLPNYPKQVIEWFPNLQILDGQQVRTPKEAADTLMEWFPRPIPALPSNLRDGGNNVAGAFLGAFFPAYDQDRPALLKQFYDDESVFSLTAEPEDSSAPYKTFTRNLEKIGARDPATHQRLFSGAAVIAELWSRLPATRHPALDDLNLWKIDCHTFRSLADPTGMGEAMGLIINVRGQFEEPDPAGQVPLRRKFHRCFILAPSKPGAPHPFRVLSDQLSIMPGQPWGAPAQVTPAVPTQPAQVPIALGDAAQPGPVAPDDVRANLLFEVSRRTGMTAEYAEMCLGAANWDLELALTFFEQKKAELPPEAFLQPS
ncbi:hypothetical protein VTJ83DRAFT_2125 [Remersonia thermophila]|uniref:mRNA export factor mex67 n=1 Tax=Remersonia thermophila TaxID=72144 RepID=A0ABR4DHT9_9PEZI